MTVVSPNGFAGEADIADNFDPAPGLIPAGGSPIPITEGASAFRMFCTAGQLAKIDPLVYPGVLGVSHLHQFFGNTGVTENSAYKSLRSSGGTTCGQSSTPFNRSAYWYPALLDGIGNVVKPDLIKLYYKRNPLSDPMCADSVLPHLGKCLPLPNGVRFVFGFNMKSLQPGLDGTIRFSCVASEDGTVQPTSTQTGDRHSIAEVAAAGCPVGAQLIIAANSPSCWDGVNLDTADHRAHMAYATGLWSVGQLFPACPLDHPHPIPNMEVLIQFTVDANFAKWHLSSDEMVAGAAAGSTFHMDYWEAWSPFAKGKMEACLDGGFSVSSGSFCDGTAIKGADVPSGGFPKHQLVPLSSIL